ncbi:uncharacterized protein LOC121795454 isoform X1 [Salvia splendens]|uniref:uncharacterized protein LOC121795454 isoform X1 n=1 Tax=Salvia splendens TaxID=180675 RepID=UPI001C25979C|nr:uncharacterized protein LOC121795454 isoform X1 [Salvia splendens]
MTFFPFRYRPRPALVASLNQRVYTPAQQIEFHLKYDDTIAPPIPQGVLEDKLNFLDEIAVKARSVIEGRANEKNCDLLCAVKLFCGRFKNLSLLSTAKAGGGPSRYLKHPTGNWAPNEELDRDRDRDPLLPLLQKKVNQPNDIVVGRHPMPVGSGPQSPIMSDELHL